MTDQKNYSADTLTAALRSARVAKGLSQRAFASQAGLPQSHLSKIEAGSVDLQLSSLLELARELDLEVMLVPRKLVPAVEALTRGAGQASRPQMASRALPELTRISNAAAQLEAIPHASRTLRQVQQAARTLESLTLSSSDFQSIRRVADSMAHMKPTANALPRLKEAAQTLQQIRNRAVHQIADAPVPQRPAYSLNEEDEDA